MVVQLWHLVVIAALVALLGWGLVAARRGTLIGLAATLLVVSGFALYTLVLTEPFLERDENSRVETLGFIGIPAILGIALLLVAKRTAGRA